MPAYRCDDADDIIDAIEAAEARGEEVVAVVQSASRGDGADGDPAIFMRWVVVTGGVSRER